VEGKMGCPQEEEEEEDIGFDRTHKFISRDNFLCSGAVINDTATIN
jgi:hypothetical protein